MRCATQMTSCAGRRVSAQTLRFDHDAERYSRSQSSLHGLPDQLADGVQQRRIVEAGLRQIVIRAGFEPARAVFGAILARKRS